MFKDVRSFTGHIPRYLNWMKGLTRKYFRSTFERDLVNCKLSQVLTAPLELLEYEQPLKDDGFIAAQYLLVICNEQKLQRFNCKNLFHMLLEFTPVFIKFGVSPCQFLKDQVGELDQEVVYVEDNLPTLEDIPQHIMEKIIKEVEQIELQFSARKARLQQTRKFYKLC